MSNIPGDEQENTIVASSGDHGIPAVLRALGRACTSSHSLWRAPGSWGPSATHTNPTVTLSERCNLYFFFFLLFKLYFIFFLLLDLNEKTLCWMPKALPPIIMEQKPETKKKRNIAVKVYMNLLALKCIKRNPGLWALGLWVSVSVSCLRGSRHVGSPHTVLIQRLGGCMQRNQRTALF